MEILRIGKHAIKISLNIDETKEYRILDSDILEEDEIKESFSKLLLKAKETVDFSYAGRKIFTEIFPSKDGGCEIYISCISMEAEKAVYKDKNQQLDNKKPKSVLSIFDFENIENLLQACYRLKEIKYKNKSSVYYDTDKKRYYMILEDIYIKDIRYAFLLEYSKYIKGSIASYIKEHYKCILKKDGVKVLSALT